MKFLSIHYQKQQCKEVLQRFLYENRYCNQDDFSVLVCGGSNRSKVEKCCSYSELFIVDGLSQKQKFNYYKGFRYTKTLSSLKKINFKILKKNKQLIFILKIT